MKRLAYLTALLATVSSAFGQSAPPALSILDATQTEGNTGIVMTTVRVALSSASSETVSVTYETADGTASATDPIARDYLPASGTLTFAPGTTQQNVSIQVNSDVLYETDEQFTVRLANATNATIHRSNGTVTISNDDSRPTVRVENLRGAEGNSGQTTFELPVWLSAPSGTAVSVNYSMSDGSATAGSDYVAASGQLTFPSGHTRTALSIAVTADANVEPDEQFSVTLSSPTNATLGTSTAVITIANDDAALPAISIANASAYEGASGTTMMRFNVTSAASPQSASVSYTTSDGTAVSAATATPGGSDYVASAGTLTFSPSAVPTTQTVNVAINGDTVFEPVETFTVTLSSPVSATIDTATATGTILKDDPAPSLSIADTSVSESNGAASLVFTVTLNNASAETVSVSYATSAYETSVWASPNIDFTPASGTLTFLPGVTTQTVPVAVIGDTTAEPNESLSLMLSSPVNAALARGTAIGIIINDDAALPSISIANAIRIEGNTASNMTFTVQLNAASSAAVTVTYATADGTATAGSDYAAASGTITFAAGETSKAVLVPLGGDTACEPSEFFSVNLSSPMNATLSTATGRGTIENDDSCAGPDLGVTQTVSAMLTYTIAVTNHGTVDATEITLSDQVPEGTKIVSATASAGTCSAGNPVICKLGTLPAGANATITITVVAPPQGHLTNRVTVSSKSDSSTTNNTATVTTSITSQ